MGVRTRPFQPADLERARQALESCGAFNAEEIAVAADMAASGLAGHYELLAVESDGRFMGFACFGRAALTQSAWYLYWICIGRSGRGQGLGGKLEAAVARRIAGLGGSLIVVETSGRVGSEHVRRFYERAGYFRAGHLPDFFEAGDDCVIYWRRLAPGGPS